MISANMDGPRDVAGWRPVGASSVRTVDDGIMFSDGGGGYGGPHLICAHNQDLRHQLVVLVLRFRPAPGSNVRLYVHCWDGPGLCWISMDDGAVTLGQAFHASCDRQGEWWHATITYWSNTDTVAIGTARDSFLYVGDGRPQFVLGECKIAVAPLPAIDPADPLIYVDAGPRLSTQGWVRAMGNQLRTVMIEADREEAARLQAATGPGTLIVANGLADQSGNRTLYVTRQPDYCSTLEPNADLLANFPAIRSGFEVVGTAEIHCVSYGELHSLGHAPVPDMLKIDVQGLEYEALRGFGSLLDNVVAIELKAYLRPLYRGQKLLPDLVALLADHGLSLMRSVPSGWFDGEVLEMTAWFAQHTARMREKSANARAKLLAARRVWSF